jgi:hypothetical protein
MCCIVIWLSQEGQGTPFPHRGAGGSGGGPCPPCPPGGRAVVLGGREKPASGLLTWPDVVGRDGIEPPTLRFSAGCDSFGSVRDGAPESHSPWSAGWGWTRSSQAIRRRPPWCGLVGQNAGRSVQLGEGLAAWVTGASPGPEVGHTAAMAVIVVCILVVDRAPPKPTSATLHPAGPTRLGNRAR